MPSPETHVRFSRTLIERFIEMDALRELAFFHRAKIVRVSGCYHDWNYSNLAKQLGVSPATAKRRIKFLKKHNMVSFYGKNLYFNSLESVVLEQQLAYEPVSILTGTSLKDIIHTLRKELFALEYKRQMHAKHGKDLSNISQRREPRTIAEAKAKARAEKRPLKSFGCPEVESMMYGSRDTLASKMGMSVSAFDKFIRGLAREGKITKRYNYKAIMPYCGEKHFKYFLQSKGGSKKYFVRLGTIYEQLANNYILNYHENRFSDMGVYFRENNIKVSTTPRIDYKITDLIPVVDYSIYDTRFDIPSIRTA